MRSNLYDACTPQNCRDIGVREQYCLRECKKKSIELKIKLKSNTYTLNSSFICTKFLFYFLSGIVETVIKRFKVKMNWVNNLVSSINEG